MTLRVGERLLCVSADTDQTLDLLRSRFATWVDDQAHGVPPVFGLLLGPPPTPTDGPIPVPQLQHGRRVIARSRRPELVLDSFDALLGGVLAEQDQRHSWGQLRLFALGDRVVGLAALAPDLVGDPQLIRHGIRELDTWRVAIDEQGRALIPPPLTSLGPTPGQRHSGEPTTGEWASYTLAGVVSISGHPLEPAEQLTQLASWAHCASWFRAVANLIDDARSVVAPDRNAARDAIRDLLTAQSGAAPGPA